MLSGSNIEAEQPRPFPIYTLFDLILLALKLMFNNKGPPVLIEATKININLPENINNNRNVSTSIKLKHTLFD